MSAHTDVEAARDWTGCQKKAGRYQAASMLAITLALAIGAAACMSSVLGALRASAEKIAPGSMAETPLEKGLASIQKSTGRVL